MIIHSPIISGSLTFASGATFVSANGQITGSFSGSVSGIGDTADFSASLNSKIESLKTDTGSQDSRLDSIESFTSSIDTTIKNKLNTETVVSGSVQVTSLLPSGVISGSSQVFSNISGDVLIASNGVSTIQANSVALGTDTTGNYMTDVSAGNAGIVISHTPSEGSTATISLVSGVVSGSSQVFSNISGDVLIASNGVSTIQANSVALGTDTTGDYVASLGSGTGVTIASNSGEGSSPTIAVNYGSSANTAVQGNTTLAFAGTTNEISIDGGSSITLGSGGTVTVGLADTITGNRTFSNNVTITGDLTVNGTTTTVNSNTVNIGDNLIVLNSDETGIPSQNGGIEIERGTSANATLIWDEGNDNWVAGLSGSEIPLVTTTGTQTLTNKTISGTNNTLSNIANASLTNSTISGISLGSNLATLTIGTGLSGTSYNGGSAVTIANSGVTSNVAGTGISVSGATGAVTISIGQAVSTSSNVQFNSIGVGMAASATAGRIDATNDVVAFSSSDIRFKENIKPIENAIDKIKKISGNTYDWKEENKIEHGYEGNDVGVIAQEIEAVLPQLVQTRESGYKAVKYDKLVALLIEGIKEQQIQINDMKVEIESLKKH